MDELIQIYKVEIEKLNEELVIQKSNAERLSIDIDDAIAAGDYEAVLDYSFSLKDTCIRINGLSSRIDDHKKMIAKYSK
jgi:hypothetical protein